MLTKRALGMHGLDVPHSLTIFFKLPCCVIDIIKTHFTFQFGDLDFLLYHSFYYQIYNMIYQLTSFSQVVIICVTDL